MSAQNSAQMAASAFAQAKGATQDPGIRALADGLQYLARAVAQLAEEVEANKADLTRGIQGLYRK